MIDFWGVGYQTAKRMGVEDQILAHGYPVQLLRSVGADGTAKADLQVAGIRRLIGDDFTSLPRGDLAAAVYQTIADQVGTIFGDSIATIDDVGDRVQVTFDHHPPREFDLVIGADGLHSNVRQLVFADNGDVEHYLGCKVAACVVHGYRPRDELVYLTYNTLDRQAGRFALRDDKTLFLFIFRADREDDTMSPTERLRHEFGSAGWECPHMLDAINDADDLYFDVVSQVRMPRWSRGRVLLIGDAAGCISLLGGEGTGLAMTEAYVLAGELQRIAGDHRRAFEQYEAKMRPLVESKQASAVRYVGFFATRTKAGLWMRNLALRAMNFGPVLKLVAGDVRDDFDLPDYGI